MSSPLPPALEALIAAPPAERRLGAFELIDPLGRGGFAPVWRAREVYDGKELRVAAVKLFALAPPGSPPLPGSQDSEAQRHKDQVIDEARAICRVEHANVVRFYALLLDEPRGVVGLAMEYVAGEALDQQLSRRGRLEVKETIDVGIAIASALSAVHASGLVHRDVKPANIVRAGDVYKLIDFGIASAEVPVGPASRARTKRTFADVLPKNVGRTKLSAVAMAYTIKDEPGAFADTVAVALTGTLGYIDPICVALGSRSTPASDLYGLGAALYECLSGQLPAEDPARGVIRGDVVDGRARPDPILTRAPDVPPELAALVDALVSPTREERPASASDVVATLQKLKVHAAAPRARSRGPRIAVAALGVAIVVLGGVGIFLLSTSRPPRRPYAPARAATTAQCTPSDPAACDALCSDGDATACHSLGLMYATGSNVPTDETRAAALYEKACDGRSAPACYALGKMLENGEGRTKDPTGALVRFSVACDAGNAQGCNAVGRFAEIGLATPADPRRAFEFYGRACDGGYPVGCANVGLYYEQGTVVTKDLARAAALYERACEAKSIVGCGSLGSLYVHGRGLPQDETRGTALLTGACDGGYAFACAELGALALEKKETAKANAYYALACDKGMKEACNRAPAPGPGPTKPLVRPAGKEHTTPQPPRPSSADHFREGELGF